MRRPIPALLTAVCLATVLPAQRMLIVGFAGEVGELDLTTAVTAPLGVMTDILGTGDDSVPTGTTYDFAAGHLYVASSVEDRVHLVDPTNWRARSLGSLMLPSSFIVTGLEWDGATGDLLGVGSDSGFGVLFRVDTTTGRATVIGNTGLTGVQSLAFDPFSAALLLIDMTTDQLYTVDRQTGAASPIGALGGPEYVVGMAHCLDNLQTYALERRPFDRYRLHTIDVATGAASAVGGVTPGAVAEIAYVPGSGRLSRAADGCGQATIFVTGSPNLGGAVEFELENTTGIGVLGFGVNRLGTPFCGCTVGHEWAVAVPGSAATLSLTATPNVLGASVFVQGLDLGGAGGCASPVLTLTDTIEVAIGN